MVLFSALPTDLGNRGSRFPHSHRHDDDEDELNILKTRPAKRYAFWGQGQSPRAGLSRLAWKSRKSRGIPTSSTASAASVNFERTTREIMTHTRPHLIPIRRQVVLSTTVVLAG